MLSIGANISRKIININKDDISKEEFVDLVEVHKLSLYRFAKSILKNDIEVEDAISESILKAYKNKNRLKNKESFKSWMMRIVSNECYDLIKRKSRFDLRENLESLNLVHIDKEYSDLREIIDDLNEEFSSVLVLFYYEDMSIKEISKVLEISEGTVKSRLSRAKSKLKVLLKEEV